MSTSTTTGQIQHASSMPVISVSQPTRPTPSHSSSQVRLRDYVDPFPLPSSKQNLDSWEEEEDDGCDEEQNYDFECEEEVVNNKTKPTEKRKSISKSSPNQLTAQCQEFKSSQSSMLDQAEMDEDETVQALKELDNEDIADFTEEGGKHIRQD